MQVLIIGAAGMIGRKLAERLARDGTLIGQTISRLTLHDVVEPQPPAGAAFPSPRSAAIWPRPRPPIRSSPAAPR
jgi:D-erythronate 2-dehydrogenase